MLRHIFTAASMLVAATAYLAPANPAYAQSDLEQLDAQLPGKLVNDPSRIDWESYGADMDASAVKDEKLPGGAARKFIIKRASEQIYTAGTNIPLTKKVKRGEDVTIGFYARATQAKTDDGRGVLRVRFQQNVEPYPGYGEKTLSIGPEWDWYEVTAKAERGLGPKNGIVVIQFGRTRQVLEIGQAIIVSGATSIAGDASAAAAKPQPAQAAEPEEALPKPLVGTGALLNQPAKRNWGLGGTAGTWTTREEPKIWLGQATRFATDSGSANAADLYATVPVESALKAGDEILIAIAARTQNAATEDGKALVGVRIQDQANPESFFANNRFKVGPNWQLIRVKTTATQDFAAGAAQIAFHLAGAEQAVDIGPVYVIKTN